MRRLLQLTFLVVVPLSAQAQRVDPIASKEEAATATFALANQLRTARSDASFLPEESPASRSAMQTEVDDVANALDDLARKIDAGEPKHITRDAYSTLIHEFLELTELSRQLGSSSRGTQGAVGKEFVDEINAIQKYLADRQ